MGMARQGQNVMTVTILVIMLTWFPGWTKSLTNSSIKVKEFIFPQPERVVAIGDLHGDISAARESLRIAGVLHRDRDEWVGGKSVVVQLGDQLDRGDNELDVLALFHKLGLQARKAGGDVHVLAGNHETMNARGNDRYATAGAKRQFRKWETLCNNKALLPSIWGDANHCQLLTRKLGCNAGDSVCHTSVKKMDAGSKSRFLALRAGGTLARDLLAKERKAVVVIGDSLFVHGGLTSDLLSAENVTEELGRMNSDLESFFMGEPRGRRAFIGEKLLWNRDYSARSAHEIEADPRACTDLRAGLARISGNVQRMVVGHSVQKSGSISTACNGLVWRIDIGMSRGVRNNSPQVLEIRAGGQIRVLTADNPAPSVQICQKSWLETTQQRVRDWIRLYAFRGVGQLNKDLN